MADKAPSPFDLLKEAGFTVTIERADWNSRYTVADLSPSLGAATPNSIDGAEGAGWHAVQILLRESRRRLDGSSRHLPRYAAAYKASEDDKFLTGFCRHHDIERWQAEKIIDQFVEWCEDNEVA